MQYNISTKNNMSEMTNKISSDWFDFVISKKKTLLILYRELNRLEMKIRNGIGWCKSESDPISNQI
jgi:hypothetical protein